MAAVDVVDVSDVSDVFDVFDVLTRSQRRACAFDSQPACNLTEIFIFLFSLIFA